MGRKGYRPEGRFEDRFRRRFALGRAVRHKRYNANFVHRNWMRGKDTPSEIEGIIKDAVVPLMGNIGDIPN